MNTFVEQCLAGDADLADIDAWVARWHDSDLEDSLAGYLGMTEAEYALWVERPEALPFILAANRWGVDVSQLLEDLDGVPMAARALDRDEAGTILSWLKQTGRA